MAFLIFFVYSASMVGLDLYKEIERMHRIFLVVIDPQGLSSPTLQ